LTKDKDNIQKAKESYEADAAELKTATTNKGIRQLYADLAEERTKTITELNTKNKQDNLSKFFAQQTQEAADRLAVTEKEKLIARLEKQLVTLKQEYNETEQKREALERQVKGISSKGTFLTLNKTIPIRQEITQLKRKAASLQAQITSAESQLELLRYKKAEAQVRHEATVQQQEDTEESAQEDTRDLQEYQEPEQENPETEGDQLETHYTADELVNFEEPTATDGYLELKATLPEKALRVLDKIEAEHTPGKTEYGEILKRAFRPMLTAGEIKQTQVNNIWLKLKSYLREKDMPVTPAQQLSVDTDSSLENQVWEIFGDSGRRNTYVLPDTNLGKGFSILDNTLLKDGTPLHVRPQYVYEGIQAYKNTGRDVLLEVSKSMSTRMAEKKSY